MKKISSTLTQIACGAAALTIGIFLFSANQASQAQESKTEIIKFEASWCGPCRMMNPIFAQVKSELSDRASFRSVDIDKDPKTAEAFRVSQLPTLVAVKDGRVVGKAVGFQNKSKLTRFVKKHSK